MPRSTRSPAHARPFLCNDTLLQQRATQLVTAFVVDDQDAIDQILDKANGEEFGVNGLVLGLVRYALLATVQAATPSDDPDDDPRNDPPRDPG